ncbi:MAG: peptidylprolyl isomerase [Gammaproteobacteria bacterium]
MIRKIIFFLILTSHLQVAFGEQKLLDAIVVIVDEDVISKRELESRIELISTDLARSNRSLPDPGTLYRQVLEIMINDSVLLQEASNRGIKITDGQLNQAMQNIARENSMSLAAFRQALINKGFKYEGYRATIRKEVTIDTLRRQYAARSSPVTKAEVDEFIHRTGGDNIEYEYRLAHILIALPDAASPERVNTALQTANSILDRLAQEGQFEQLANEFSSGSNALQGGDLGWRKKAEVPSLFSKAVQDMTPGDYAGPIRSPSGFHIVSLTDRRDAEQVLTEQTRTRHILIRSNDLISEEDAKSRLDELHDQILAGGDFAKLARLHSVDYASGADGGDIGWMDPGGTVIEYENVAKLLRPGEISEPFRSQFGWHIVEVTGRRTVDETKETKRRKIESQLLQRKQREAFDIWTRRLRDEAYVVFPDAQT